MSSELRRCDCPLAHDLCNCPPAGAGVAAVPLAGDLVADLAHRIGADRAARWVAGKIGTDCGCKGRQDALNRVDASIRRFLGRHDR